MDDIELSFSEAALDSAAEKALKHKTGARGLRTILEQILLDVMYELPSMTGVSKCIVDADSKLGNVEITLETETGEAIPLPDFGQKSA